MEAIFLQLLNMSITASWLVLAVILLRLLLKKAPKALFCVMWGLVALRLLCPVSFESIFSLIPSVETVPQDIATSDVPMIVSGMTFVDNTINSILMDTVMPNVTSSVNPMQIVTSVASVIWIAGMVVMLLYMVISYLRIYLKVLESLWVAENIFICDRIDTPFIFGFFRPHIYLPSAIQEGDKEYVIAHEKAHLSRHDHWWKPLGYLLLTVYWFNPILWVAYILLCKDIELACDEKVIRQLGVESKKAYADALINCSAPRKMITACPLAFGETGVKNRIKSVLNYKKPAFWIILIALVACVVVSVCFLTNPASVKLTQIDDGHGTDQFGKMFVTNPTITLVHGEQEYRVENNAPVLEELEKIKVRAKPISISRSEDRAQDYTIILNAGTGHECYLYFNHDFTEYWINDLVKPSQTYKVQNPSVVRNIFETYMQEEAGTETPTVSSQPTATSSTLLAADHLVSITPEDLVGDWTIDAVYTKELTGKDLQEMYGSALGTYGCGMKFDDKGNFNYYIAIRTGGQGTYKVANEYQDVYVEMIEYKGNQQVSFVIQTVSIDGNIRLLKYEGNDLIAWKKV